MRMREVYNLSFFMLKSFCLNEGAKTLEYIVSNLLKLPCSVTYLVLMTSSDLRPNVVMELDDYSSTFELLTLDFKARVKIHNYEVKKLGEDIRHFSTSFLIRCSSNSSTCDSRERSNPLFFIVSNLQSSPLV